MKPTVLLLQSFIHFISTCLALFEGFLAPITSRQPLRALCWTIHDHIYHSLSPFVPLTLSVLGHILTESLGVIRRVTLIRVYEGPKINGQNLYYLWSSTKSTNNKKNKYENRSEYCKGYDSVPITEKYINNTLDSSI